jgi:hypothetical protein
MYAYNFIGIKNLWEIYWELVICQTNNKTWGIILKLLEIDCDNGGWVEMTGNGLGGAETLCCTKREFVTVRSGVSHVLKRTTTLYE